MARTKLFTKTTAKLRNYTDADDYLLALVELLTDINFATADNQNARDTALAVMGEGMDLNDPCKSAEAKNNLMDAVLAGNGDFAATVAKYCEHFRELEPQKDAPADALRVMQWIPVPTIDAWIVTQYLRHSPRWEPRPVDLVDRYYREYPEGVDRATIARRCKALGLKTDTSPGRQ